MIVHLRKKTISKKRFSLYLEYYHKGKRKFEFLNMYIYSDKNLGIEKKKHNKEAISKANIIKSEREVAIYKGKFSLFKENRPTSYLKYLESFVNEKGNYHKYSYVHFKNFIKKDIQFSDLTVRVIRDFKDYLLKHCTNRTASNYFVTIRMSLNQAIKEELIERNPCETVSNIRINKAKREYLTLEELKILYKAECDLSTVKKAFLFSCFTGLRISDVMNLEYSNIINNQISIYQKKTKDYLEIPINDFAFSLIDRNIIGKNINVFLLPSYSKTRRVLIKWAKEAGLKKHVTFHVSRHTFATLQLTLGTDIYTVSKLLGHKNLETTQIYAKVIDQKKSEAIRRMPEL